MFTLRAISSIKTAIESGTVPCVCICGFWLDQYLRTIFFLVLADIANAVRVSKNSASATRGSFKGKDDTGFYNVLTGTSSTTSTSTSLFFRSPQNP